jgi:hypothetical protein
MEIKGRHKAIQNAICEINKVVWNFTDEKVTFFNSINLNVRYHNHEVCFFDIVNWLYVLFYEVSVPSLKFINKKIDVYGIEMHKDVKDVLRLIHALRTIQNHNLDLKSKNDISRVEFCEDWYISITGERIPSTDDKWKLCVEYLIEKSESYIGRIDECLTRCRENDDHDIILYEWLRLVDREFPLFEYEKILVNVLNDYGLAGIFDSRKIVIEEINKWRQQISILSDGFDFKKEAYRIVSAYIEAKKLCPIFARDLIELGAPKGPHLIKMMDEVREMFYGNPCSRELLIQRILEKNILGRR